MNVCSRFLTGLFFFGSIISSAFALTVPVSENTYTSSLVNGQVIYLSSGAAVLLAVNARDTALLQFNLSDPNTVPATVTPVNISSAILQLYIVNAAPAGALTVYAITSPWSENFPGRSEPAPTISGSAIATIPGSEIGIKKFVSVDVTAAVKTALASGTSYGFAIAATGGTKVAVGSKDGPAVGPAAQLDIETNGQSALLNTTVGFNALVNDTTGFYNSAIGSGALFANTSGSSNAAFGAGALDLNTIGSGNVAIGNGALFSNTNGDLNVAIGDAALTYNTMGIDNTASGEQALSYNTIGGENTADGIQALFNNAIGSQNTAVGAAALTSATDGENNIAFGVFSGSTLTTGSNNIYIGNWDAVMGSSEPASESDTIRIGNPTVHTATYIAGVNGASISGGAQVFVSGTDGQLGIELSSSRFKTAIAPMGDSSNVLLDFKPVTFRYKAQYDPKGTPQFGLVAEEVAKVCPALVLRDAKGEIETVRYEQVNAMLLNEFLKEHQRVAQQAAELRNQEQKIAEDEKRFAAQQSQIETLTAGLAAMQQQMTRIAPAANLSTAGEKVATSAPPN